MNISKNLLSLGLIAIISGISIAQTYTGTAGTNGTIDIQSDYSQATGDGASVSVDVPLEFELPKKVAITVLAPGINSYPAGSLFEDIQNASNPYYSSLNNVLGSLAPHATYPNITAHGTDFKGGIYANTSISISFSDFQFVHENDSNSIIEARKCVHIGNGDGTNYETEIYGSCDSPTGYTGTSILPTIVNIDETQGLVAENTFSFQLGIYPYLDTIDSTDRAGKYLASQTITVSTL